MPTIDETIYVALPDVLGLDPNEMAFEELHETLVKEAVGATSITVLGGYMSPGYVRALCAKVPRRGNGGRGGFPLRIAIGLEPSRPLGQQWADLRKLKADLQADGFRSVEVKAVLHGGIHFHTKLFGFIRTTQPSWYVGSANPSGTNRHEMMVRVGRKHEAIAAYAEAALAKAIEVSGEAPAEASGTLRAFFQSGFLAHKPPNPRVFTFDAFRFSPAERDKLDEGAGVRLGLRHANPKTEGYGFNLASALGDTAFQDGDGAKKKVQHSGSSVDTVFGFWMPGPYASELRWSYRQEETARERRLAAFSARLCSDKGLRVAHGAFDAYLEDMAKLLRERGIERQPDQGYEDRFTKFLTSRARLLENEERRARHARIMVLQEMPDIWPDERSAMAFEESFFEDVAFRASSVGRKARVIRSILDGIGEVDSADPHDIRHALERRLGEDPWTDEDWGGQRHV